MPPRSLTLRNVQATITLGRGADATVVEEIRVAVLNAAAKEWLQKGTHPKSRTVYADPSKEETPGLLRLKEESETRWILVLRKGGVRTFSDQTQSLLESIAKVKQVTVEVKGLIAGGNDRDPEGPPDDASTGNDWNLLLADDDNAEQLLMPRVTLRVYKASHETGPGETTWHECGIRKHPAKNGSSAGTTPRTK